MLNPELQDILADRSDIFNAFDDKAMSVLEAADVDRAKEVLHDLVSKQDIRNPSAFLVKALTKFPHKRKRVGDVEQLLSQYPGLETALDDSAKRKLYEVDPSRAAQILEDLVSKKDVRNPSAFITSSLEQCPQKRGKLDPDGASRLGKADERRYGVFESESEDYGQLLQRHPEIDAALDDKAKQRLFEADPSRSLEILRDLIKKKDVRNPSAFIVSNLAKFQQQRSNAGIDSAAQRGPARRPKRRTSSSRSRSRPARRRPVRRRRRGSSSRSNSLIRRDNMRHHGGPMARRVYGRAPGRAYGRPYESRSPSVRRIYGRAAQPRFAANPGAECSRGDVTLLLGVNPNIAAALDDAAKRQLFDVPPSRAVEILEELIAKPDIRNPSAFVAGALSNFSYGRQRPASDTAARWAEPDAFDMAQRPMSECDQLLRRYPHIAAALDHNALRQLQDADPDRVAELIEDVAARPDIVNVSGFLVKGLKAHPEARNRNGARGIAQQGKAEFAQFLSQYPKIDAALDDRAFRLLQAADPGRAMELIEEVAAKQDVANISAFIVKGLKSHPEVRNRHGPRVAGQRDGDTVDMTPEATSELEMALNQYPDIASALDMNALSMLQAADPSRAVELIMEVATKGDVSNVSAFVVKGLRSHPRVRNQDGPWTTVHRGAPMAMQHRAAETDDGPTPNNDSDFPDLDLLLSQYPEIQAALDDGAYSRLLSADPRRAIELIEDVAAKGDVVNVSGFIMKALKQHPNPRHKGSQTDTSQQAEMAEDPGAEIEQFLSQYPEIDTALDQGAFHALKAAEPERAKQLIEDVAAKGNVANPSGFIMKALKQHPRLRNRELQAEPSQQADVAQDRGSEIDQFLSHYPEIDNALDEGAIRALRAADPERARQLIEDVAAKGDVANPSGFIMKALKQHPRLRNRGAQAEASQQVDVAQDHGSEIEQFLSQYPEIDTALDEGAFRALQVADPERAKQIIEDVAAKGNVANPSGFIMKALKQHPRPRNRGVQSEASQQVDATQDRGSEIEQFLSHYPEIDTALDEGVFRALQAADPERAKQIIEDVAAKGDVANPSGFIMKALKQHPRLRNRRLQAETSQQADVAQDRGSEIEHFLSQYPEIDTALDDGAFRALQAADPSRAKQLIEDVAAKGDVANISAFVMKALKSQPQRRRR